MAKSRSAPKSPRVKYYVRSFKIPIPWDQGDWITKIVSIWKESWRWCQFSTPLFWVSTLPKFFGWLCWSTSSCHKCVVFATLVVQSSKKLRRWKEYDVPVGETSSQGSCQRKGLPRTWKNQILGVCLRFSTVFVAFQWWARGVIMRRWNLNCTKIHAL